MKRKRYGFIILLWILLCLPRDGAAALFEQLAVDTRAMSLGNSVTADPEGAFSIHYNPPGWIAPAGRNSKWVFSTSPS